MGGGNYPIAAENKRTVWFYDTSQLNTKMHDISLKYSREYEFVEMKREQLVDLFKLEKYFRETHICIEKEISIVLYRYIIFHTSIDSSVLWATLCLYWPYAPMENRFAFTTITPILPVISDVALRNMVTILT